MYYPAELDAIQTRMRAGDLLVLAVKQSGDLLILLASTGSEREREPQLLFGIDDSDEERLQVRELHEPIAMDFVAATILEDLGIARVELPSGGDSAIVARLIETLITEFASRLPADEQVASLVRGAFGDVGAREEPDAALVWWIEAEAAAFRGWEDAKIGARLRQGFSPADGAPDVESFRAFSMSLRQSRVSRAGGALEYHIRELLDVRGLRNPMKAIIDHGERPDFLFPSKAPYDDASFDAAQLRMLGVKYTAEDRWRQVLNEARRIEQKYLLMLEPSITASQVSQMRNAKLQLVIPAPIRARYPAQVAGEISTVAAFLGELERIQTRESARD